MRYRIVIRGYVHPSIRRSHTSWISEKSDISTIMQQARFENMKLPLNTTQRTSQRKVREQIARTYLISVRIVFFSISVSFLFEIKYHTLPYSLNEAPAEIMSPFFQWNQLVHYWKYYLVQKYITKQAFKAISPVKFSQFQICNLMQPTSSISNRLEMASNWSCLLISTNSGKIMICFFHFLRMVILWKLTFIDFFYRQHTEYHV